MDQEIVERLEARLEKAIAETMAKLGKKRLPAPPSRHTLRMMAKAAAAVYEAAAEEEMHARE